MVAMTKLATIDTEEARPYHHGDLRRALCDAARTILERDGPQALSLRAVAREAGVSPAAPYHHFKDKRELLNAVGDQGFEDLAVCIEKARDAAEPHRRLTAIGAAYVKFARANPALYRVMYDCARDGEDLPMKTRHQSGGAYGIVRDAIVEAGRVEATDTLGLELSCTAAWCMAHGLAEMASFQQFDHLRQALGDDQAFYEAVLSHVGMFS